MNEQIPWYVYLAWTDPSEKQPRKLHIYKAADRAVADILVHRLCVRYPKFATGFFKAIFENAATDIESIARFRQAEAEMEELQDLHKATRPLTPAELDRRRQGADGLKSLAVDCAGSCANWERDLANDDASEHRVSSVTPDPVALAVTMKLREPKLTVRKAAEAVAIHYTVLQKDKTSQAAVYRLKQQAKGNVRPGSKSSDGQIETVADDDEEDAEK
jgi:hypothetical protein